MVNKVKEESSVPQTEKHLGRVFSYDSNTKRGFMELSFIDKKVAFKADDLSKVANRELTCSIGLYYYFDIIKDQEGVEYAVNFEV
ncbi:hypothetical protein H6784_05665 [Candidatus Nomurabacteria bacterium]|nr:hypothetical protein [Candidatus Kaiserbacteria bacterium]MCB9814864.1 hypothetical protein [Candidatus Nomurabacteria bacterium]